MATLTADVTAEATSWNVSALPGVEFLQVDDEIVRVLDQKRTQNRLRVERGYAGTTAAEHAADTELVPAYVPSPLRVVSQDGTAEAYVRITEDVITLYSHVDSGSEWVTLELSATSFDVLVGGASFDYEC